MKKNTGCNDSHGCPPSLACDKAKTKISDCELFPGPITSNAPITRVLDALVPLAQFELEVDVEADVYLPTAAREIKWIRKNVTLTQCKAVPSSQLRATDSPHPGFVVKLYISGILHKNIQYVEDCSGFVKDYSVDVHFNCVERIVLTNPIRRPIAASNGLPDDIAYSQKASVMEYRELADDGMGANNCVTGSETFEFFNEPIECKLLGQRTREIDLLKDYDSWGRFRKITEKAEIRLFLKLLQMQQVPF
jgi:hypothetical protein